MPKKPPKPNTSNQTSGLDRGSSRLDNPAADTPVLDSPTAKSKKARKSKTCLRQNCQRQKTQKAKTSKHAQDAQKSKSPYFHEISDTLEGWDALAKRIEEVKKRADKIQVPYLITEEDVAAFLSITRGWLGERRTAGRPPFYYKLGKGPKTPVRYSLAEVMDYLMICCRCHSTSDDSLLDSAEVEAKYFDKYGRKRSEQSLSSFSISLTPLTE